MLPATTEICGRGGRGDRAIPSLPLAPRHRRSAAVRRKEVRRIRGGPWVAAGFTVLEAIVALAVFAGGAMAFYSLYSTNVTTLMKASDAVRQAPLVRQAAERLVAMNLTAEAEGEFEVEGMRFDWSARRLGDYREGQNNAGLLGSFRLGLYEVDFTASEGARELGRYRLRLVGRQWVRPAFEQSG